ncbi:unnamed protein product [Linum trigynum]|uniref:F-box domain-containing protein n=1 Tax=Linum trigynum TaxID=586398 RepID=A0AAV2F682_9ROSI
MEEAEEGNAAGETKKSRGGGGSCNRCMINDVGEELLTDILIRLPLDQIYRCKSVCKHWLSLIQSPLFRADYSRKKQKQNQNQKKKKQSIKLSCIGLHPHPQQNSPVLIANNEYDHNDDVRKRLEFSLDFVPDLPQLHGADVYNQILQQAADDKKNYAKEKQMYSWLSAQRAMLNAIPDVESKKKRIQEILNSRRWPKKKRYYSNRDFILGSSNGLLLCAPLLFTPKYTGFFMYTDPVFDDFPASYVVCNPYTKQWIQVPPPPPSSSITPHAAANVGFVSDFDSMDRGGGCWFKIARLPLDLESLRGRSFELQVFSSHSWEWTTLTSPSLPRLRTATLPSLPWPIWVNNSERIVVAVTLKKKKKNGGGPRLCWMVNRCRAIVYDPIKNVVDVVIGVMQQPPDRGLVHGVVVFDAMCVSRGCLWAGSLRCQTVLKIFRASGKKWEMVEEFDVQQVCKQGAFTYTFMTMNPDDPQQVYLRNWKSVFLLNLRTKTLKVVATLENLTNGLIERLTIVCENPLWPTPLPSPILSPSS